MAELTQTPANVSLMAQTSLSLLRPVQYGEAVSNGMPVYLHTDTKYYKAAPTTALTAAVVGIAVVGGALDGYGVIVLPGAKINIGATLIIGTMYAIGDTTAGAIGPESDLGSADFPCSLGYSIAAGTLDFSISLSGVAKA